jgi:hypothetical protein
MPDAEVSTPLEQLLQHPALWRGRSVAPIATFATGFAALDQALPGGGWPRTGLIEILTAQQGVGELQLWLPALAALTSAAKSTWAVRSASPGVSSGIDDRCCLTACRLSPVADSAWP